MNRMMRLGLSAFVLVSPLLLVACGDDDEPQQQQQPPTATATGAERGVGRARRRRCPARRHAAGGVHVGWALLQRPHLGEPGGEIRGQLDNGGTVRFAALDGAQETPAVTTTARGAGALSVDEASGAVSGFVVTSGLVGANRRARPHRGAGRVDGRQRDRADDRRARRLVRPG